ncbi:MULTISPECIES: DUF1844 domain-containing protein [unclassified Gordonia (in: high G+C Gram-positive bacteria)]|uniref:DUF1844 domain-containing protein n=1 Tax=unclassified Gordonia (in: high G+C Gram-positive bacteria) TaxID=2657482 RepID=UPI001FFF2F02|nr:MULTISPECIES: DUF1844 domain-containing protein [unclassified Gordonia (in: high G+C Gram-positive bacteria)]UQE73471.1 DUF1844 domain-containing protein [Gordonia sp. PP30]
MSADSHSTDPSGTPESSADDQVRELATIPAIEVITRAAVMLMSAAAEKIGPEAGGDEQYRDLPEARALITALAGLVTASAGDLGLHRKPIRDGLTALQLAFREASAYPDAPGEGPGEKLTGPVKG